MNRPVIVIAAVMTFVIAVINVVLASNLILPLSVMVERAGAMTWYITWAMVWVSVFCAVALGAFLLAAAAKKR